MEKTLVAYFSASGVTARVARNLADAIGAHLHEIVPTQPYTDDDLDWHNSLSRTSLEMKDSSSRPAVSGRVKGMADYDTVFLGFPIWWYVAPTIINTFLEQYDWEGKIIVPFATSAGSGMGETNRRLAPSCKGADLRPGRCFPASTSAPVLRQWAEMVR